MAILCFSVGLKAQIIHTAHFSESEYQLETQADGRTFIRSNSIINLAETSDAVTLSRVTCNNEILHVELEGRLTSDSNYSITLRNIMGTDSYTNSMSGTSENFNLERLSKGMYVVVLSVNGVEIDSHKIFIK